jgi:hypothetical protein
MARTSADYGRAGIRGRLEETRGKLLSAIGGLTEEQMRRRPGPGRWSVAEVMAHLPVWERHMLRQADLLRQDAGRTVDLPSQAERDRAAARGRHLPPPGIVHDLVGARWDTLTFLERLTAGDLDRPGVRSEQDALTPTRVLSAIADYEQEQASRIRRLREDLGLPPPGAQRPPL